MYPMTAKPVTLYGRAFSRLFFPETCPLCANFLRTWEKKICGSCESLFCELRAPLCLQCARELPPFSGAAVSVCGDCRHVRHEVDRTWTLFSYNEPFKKILHLIKFCGKPALLRVFENKLKDFAEATDWPAFDFMIPVPLDRIRQWERGFNQSYLLTLLLEKFLRIPIDHRILQKKSTASPQSTLPKKERLLNIRGSFKVREAEKIRGRHILLVDDIYTTGATVNECARILKEAGAGSVCAFTLARASLGKDMP